MKVTVIDIAKKAGVSQSTVSKVLNNYPTISKETREKVLDAIKELEFYPDLVARSLVTKKTKTIGLIVGDISNPFFSETAKVVITDAREQEIDVIISDTDYRLENLELALRNMVGRRVDGILVASVDRRDTVTTDLAKKEFPIVLFNRHTDDKGTPYVVTDNEKGSQLAVQHLNDLGHRRIAYISGSLSFSTFHQRYNGYKKALAELNLTIDPMIVYSGQVDSEKIKVFLKKVLSLKNRPTSLYAASDQIAITVIDILAEMGLRVPTDFSVVGFDNIDIASNPHINLTTISQNKQEMAEIALEKLLNIINSKEDELPFQIILEPELIIRSTTKSIQ
ncbi:LacI family DNA-binding transcriptional regulator [Sporosarcina cascadiensis]|uniref:LacI family DNA-binding transcriptional regulator n=1 Tax=Sporosarcina cascadiensis TaxID=2660747 RepID=UPI00129AF9A5|nr:LacI family DNA-binding transcriptional regulator [Sporosarcina cascadiensis]